MQTIKTASDLKYWHEKKNPDSYFFTRKTMRFFGDTVKNYGVRLIVPADNPHRKYYELYRRRPVKFGVKSSAYFDAETFEQVHPGREST